MAKESSKSSIYAANNQFGKNKVRKLKKHVALHPEDATAVAALKAYSSSAKPSPRWGTKGSGSLSSSQRLHDQLTRKVRAGQRQLQYLLKHTNIEPQGSGFTSDQLKARDRAHQEASNI